ncbi:MAG TPA: hypothetical protein VJ921_14160, partial [Vicinamibacteria bacterium]|nr:hypothetical protein [Vicinamibacteria bacterium]
RVTRNIVIAPAFEMAGRLLLSLGRTKSQEWRRAGKIRIESPYGAFDLGYQFADRLENVELVEIRGGDHRLTAYKERLFEEMWRFVDSGSEA